MSDPHHVPDTGGQAPIPSGFGGNNTCESLGLALWALEDNCPWGCVGSDDITNAFNSVGPQAVLEGVARLAPYLLPWTSLSLGVPSP